MACVGQLLCELEYLSLELRSSSVNCNFGVTLLGRSVDREMAFISPPSWGGSASSSSKIFL